MRRSVIGLGAVVVAVGLGTPLSAQSKVDTAPKMVSTGQGESPALQVANSPLDRRVSIDLRDVPLGDVLKEINRQAELGLAYSPQVVPLDRVVTLRVTDVPAGRALERVLAGTGVRARVAGGTVFLEKQASSHDTSGRGPSGTIVGQIIDSATGRGVPEVEVLLSGTPWRTQTDTVGRYHLVEVDTGTYTLIARRLGYKRQTRRVQVVADKEQAVDFRFVTAAVALDELVTTATGQQRRRDLGNAITTIQADSVLRNAPIRNLTDLLQNRVPGMSLQHTSGAPGDPARIRLRGLASVMRGNDPVVVIDGVRVYSAQSEARSGNLTNLAARGTLAESDRLGVGDTPAPSPIDQIDPNIIEKIEVFKGPSAATLYGADAANGVIVITTKRGKPGPTRWEAHLIQGRTTPAGQYPVGYYRWGHVPEYAFTELCPLTYLRCEQDSLVRYQALNDPDMTIFDRGRRTELSLTASGGSQALTYSVTGTYGDEVGLLRLPSFEVDRFRTTFNREAPDWMRRPHQLRSWSVASNVTALLGRTADVTLSTKLSRSEQHRTSLESQQTALAGTYVDKVNGIYYTPRRGSLQLGSSSYWLNPNYSTALNAYYRRSTASTITFTTGLTANWRPRSWFTGVAQAGLDVAPRDDETFTPSGLLFAGDSGALARGSGRSLTSTFDLRGQLRKPLRWGFNFVTSAGANLVTTSTNDLVSSATGLVPGTSSLSGATRISATDARVNTSVFGWYVEPQITGQRISLSMGLRLDGGSSYGARITRTNGGLLGGLLGLPKLNGSWVISEEPWFPFNAVFSSFRLRGAYGQAQVQPGAADRLRLYDRRVDGARDLLVLSSVGNNELRPERSTEFEGGFDADLLDSRVSVELTAYRKLQVDALMPVTLPVSVMGGGTVVRNVGNIRNTGLEVRATVTPVQSSLVTWSATLNYSRNTNTLVKLGPGVEANPRQGLVAGYPVGGRWSRPILGYADRDGNGVIESGEVQVGDSLVFMGRLLPAYQSALFSDVTLFGGVIGISASLSYNAGQTQVDQTASTNWVLSRALVDPATPLDQQAAVAVYDSTDYGVTQTVSTLRFQSLSVRYRTPRTLARLFRAQELSVALQGDNLGLHSTYRGKDPDVTAWSPTEHIVDTGQLAQPRTWQLRVDLRY